MIHAKDYLCTDCKIPIKENVYCEKCYNRLLGEIKELEKRMGKKDKEKIKCPSCKLYKDGADFYWDEDSKVIVCFECYYGVGQN